ncbi:hypothetical protein FM104_05795 [Microbacterium esteraromaticum]|uniref:Uncharacterized protein n=1 Tax=Microbacterium esteraromaticum TaxID=57043 RepID=A0A1R4J7B3_9MICO|nr:hypothetical protein [Microbacterium esteraromaticum]SJN27922.1 hypothetical protein FM104_05795 [Microbacterium esteraromaticum]
MEPFWTLAAELWWIVPVVGGTGAALFAVFRRHEVVNGKRLGYDAARLELRQAQEDAKTATVSARVARAEAARVHADRAASRADAAAVATARRVLREAQLQSKAAAARVKAGRARVAAERTALSAGGLRPLDRLRGRHDAVLARWMEYETDPAKILAFPAMSDGRHPVTASFLAALQDARDRRPHTDGARFTASDYGAYRDAVERLERNFDAAERSVRGESRSTDMPEALRDAARTFVEKSTDVLNQTTDALNRFWPPRRPHDG